MITSGLVLPQKLEIDNATLSERYGKFVAEPFEKGYGHTVGHSLRRILLASLEGAAVSAVRIKGAPHEFSSLKNVREDVINIIMNLKQLRLKMFSAGPEILQLSTKKEGDVKARDIKSTSNVEILNPDLVIATLDAGGEINMEIEVSRGRGYMPAERLRRENQPVNTIPVDALFSPVTKVHYEVENARVGQMTDYDKLIIEIWTDGSVSPADALSHAAKIMKDSISTFATFEEAEAKSASSAMEPRMEEKSSRVKDMLNQPVDIIELSVRASNCLKAAKIKTIGELVTKTEEELLAFKNFGKKSLDEIIERLQEMELSLGMKV